MNTFKLETIIGDVEYYVMDDVYPDSLAIFVKFENEESENEFLVKKLKYTRAGLDAFVDVYARGYKQGRWRGMWEKAKKVRELFLEIKAELL